jgi:hypothetical protein
MPAQRELPPPDPAMTERVVAAALAALPRPRRRRRRIISVIALALAVAVAVVVGLLVAPSSSSRSENLPRGPLAFSSMGRGTVELDKFPGTWVFTVGRASQGGFLPLGSRVRELVDAVDLNTHIAVAIAVANRDSVQVRRVTVRRFDPSRLQFCLRAAVPQVPLGMPRTFAYEVIRVKKTRSIAKAVPSLDFQPFLLRDQTGRILSPMPLGLTKVRLCPR